MLILKVVWFGKSIIFESLSLVSESGEAGEGRQREGNVEDGLGTALLLKQVFYAVTFEEDLPHHKKT